ncbi:hypothetical protein B0H13DRAFT_2365584 [Mycena leptocephala]|nr:hypothetical protein B0H13DRAFT_2365584 [Mycena leptocephala]
MLPSGPPAVHKKSKHSLKPFAGPMQVPSVTLASDSDVKRARIKERNACAPGPEWSNAVAMAEWGEVFKGLNDFYGLDKPTQYGNPPQTENQLLAAYLSRYMEIVAESGSQNKWEWVYTDSSEPLPFEMSPEQFRKALDRMPKWSPPNKAIPKIKLFAPAIAEDTKNEDTPGGTIELEKVAEEEEETEEEEPQVYGDDLPATETYEDDWRGRHAGALAALLSPSLRVYSLSFGVFQMSRYSRCRTRHDNGDSSIFYEEGSEELTADRAVFASADGLRLTQQAINVGVKKRLVQPSDLEDPYGDWDPVPEGAKRKRYNSSDNPNVLWRRLQQTFLDEMVRGDGLGDALSNPVCACCTADASQDSSRGIFRCSECGIFLQCKACILTRHAMQPLHILKEWNQHFWKDVSLESLGIVYQLGHGGQPCKAPANTLRTMVVIHTNGVHTVHYRYCGCDLSDHANNLEQLLCNSWYPASTIDPATCATFDALETYRLLNVIGNINVKDYVSTLERMGDPTRIRYVPDRYKAFGRMVRQFSFLKRAKRAGRAHNIKGLSATKNGACVVLCWACPHDGINLPEGWRDVAPEFRFLYMLILAVDANFRLKNRLRKNEHDDPSFGSGWSYLVEDGPYRKHLAHYVAEKDVSTCIVFAALLQKDTRMTTGLRCSGVGGVVCACHELVRPQGVGDLQKGERYSNMDYIVLSALIGMALLWLTISYDIACQWQINLERRKEKMPEHLQLTDDVTIQYGLPVWHAAAHEKSCQAQNSLNYLEGVGRTDGEGIERTWSEKNIGQGDTLPRKLVVAIAERDVQVAAFREVDSTLRSDLRGEWQQRIDNWVADKTQPNPYEMEGGRRSGPTEAAVRRELKTDELREKADDAEGAHVHQRGTTAFLVAGMQLEELQQRIRTEAKGRTLLAGDQTGRIQELRLSFGSKLRNFRVLQARHMPAAVQELEDEEEERDPDSLPPAPEYIKLWMPSELKERQRETGCTKGLARQEATLQEAQCRNALDLLRTRLHAKRHMLLYRGQFVGQKGGTRSHTLVGQIGERVDAIAAKYRRGRGALAQLKGEAYCDGLNLRELTAADVKLDEEQESDAVARQRLAKIGSTMLSSKKKHFSWIWTVNGGPEADEEGMHESVRVEWSKAKARRDRWTEELALLCEEMKRVMRYLRWRAAWWERRRHARGVEIPEALRAGLDAYAARQAALHRGIVRRFKAEWDTSRAGVVRAAAAEDFAQQDGMTGFMAAEEERLTQ